jgi:SAM-dependent methyltransferase
MRLFKTNKPQAIVASNHSPALNEAVRILQPPSGVPWRCTSAGFLDVLGEADPIDTRFVHQLVNTKILPRIYERIWRPIVGWFLFGRGLRKGEERRITVDMLDISGEDRVLDVGCGPGNYTRVLAQQVGSGTAIGVDASATMLDVAMKRGGGENLAYVRADACALPFEDESFDAVCCVGVIHMIDNAMGALNEMVRVLAPGGRLVIVASCGDVSRRAELPGGVRVFGSDELTGAFAERGLEGIVQRLSKTAQFVGGQKPEV